MMFCMYYQAAGCVACHRVLLWEDAMMLQLAVAVALDSLWCELSAHCCAGACTLPGGMYSDHMGPCC
jgi:hypothetical protein